MAIRMNQKENTIGEGLHCVLWSPQSEGGDITLMECSLPPQTTLTLSLSPLPVDCCPPGRFSLLHRPSQVHFSSVYLPGHHAAHRAPPCQPPLQDGPH